jgi:hypothetical protein
MLKHSVGLSRLWQRRLTGPEKHDQEINGFDRACGIDFIFSPR